MLLAVAAGASVGVGQVPLPPADLVVEMPGWADSVTVGGERWAIPALWRGRRIGLSDQPPPADLLPVPPELCAPRREPLLRAEAMFAFREMAAVAAGSGIELRVQSGYRSPSEQIDLIERRLAAGREFAEIIRGVAPPGYSEHMLGTTVDLALGGDYANNPAYAWLVENAANFGFVETYPRDAPDGFPWEPWHWRYVGEEALARDGRGGGQAPNTGG
jgi:D-alanyl-D-alanine carboxypeptidase